MSMNKKKFALIAIVMLLIAVIAFYKNRKTVADKLEESGLFSNDSSGVQLVTNEEPIKGTMPDLNHKITFDSSVTADRKITSVQSITTLKELLEKDERDWDAWVDLSNYVSAAGDDSYALVILEFVATNTPEWALPLGNMGMIYGYHLHDNAKAEVAFRTAIAREPNVTYYWIQLYQFLTDIGQTSRAKDVLREGISKKVSGYQDLQVILSSTK